MSDHSLFQELEQLLRPHSQYTSEDGIMLKNSVVEAALQLRPHLLKLILGNEKLKANFFTEVEDILVFDKVRFQKFVMNKRFLPDSYTSFKNKIGLTTDDGDFLADSREVVLSWPYKDCVLEGGQTKEDAKRNEVFWNEILAPDEINRLTEPKTLSNFKKYDADGEHTVKSISKADNLIIKGNNLLALHSLKKNYAGQVKLIYIDPPYNTGNDGFQYNDAFNHSSWLTFMRNRLTIARELLSENGMIFIQITDIEQAYLKILLDEVFGKDNFIEQIIWKKRGGAPNDKIIGAIHEYILLYSKNKFQLKIFRRERQDKQLQRYNNPDNHPKGDWSVDNLMANVKGGRYTQSLYYAIINPETGEEHYPSSNGNWRFNKEKIALLIQNNEIYFGEDGKGRPKLKRFLCDVQDGIPYNTIWDDVPTGMAGTSEIKELFGSVNEFDTAKPEGLISELLMFSTQPNDIVLDYHLGSGTTAAVAHKMNRRYIGIEQMDYIETVAVERLKKVIGVKTEVVQKTAQQGSLDFMAEQAVGYQTTDYDQGGISKAVNWKGGGSFVYCELAKANQELAERILASDNKEELRLIWEQMQETGFLSWKVNPKQIDENAEDFAALSVEDTQKFLLEALDKNLLYIPYSEIDNQEFGISDDDKRLNAQFYGKAK